MKNVSFSCFDCDEIPEVAALGLANTMDAAKPLLDAIGIPRQVVIDHKMRAAVQVNAFAGSIGRDQNQNFGVLFERFLNLATALARSLTVDGDNVIWVAQ